VVIPFDKIAGCRGSTGGGRLGDSRGQLTYAAAATARCSTLGKWWSSNTRLPLPLAPTRCCVRWTPAVQRECCRMMRESIICARSPGEALEYALPFAGDMDAALAEKFVGLYVNHYTVGWREL